MASEDQDILAKISQLAGQINKHKNKQPEGEHSDRPTQSVSSRGNFSQPTSGWRPSRGSYSSRGYARGGRIPQVHRNRTLVLNGINPTSNQAAADLTTNSDNLETPPTKTVTTGRPAWVTKTDRHLQLINTSIFEKDSQNRAKAIEETRKQKLKQRDEREKAKLNKHLQRLEGNSTSAGGPPPRSINVGETYEINVQGIRFRVAKNGSKLVKDAGDLNSAKSTPKTALVGGVRFYRSKNGNMFRSGIVKAHRRNGAVKKINEPCKMFTTTGSCAKGPRCRYIHDPRKVAVCKEFLLKGSCPSGDSCDLSHELIPEITPTCMHFAKGNCSNPTCRYAHVHLSPNAPVCRAFGIYGYCERGSSCDERHVNECPDFSNTGVCKTKGCKLQHRHKASVMRGSTVHGEIAAEDNSSDVSSDDEEEEIGSDDVDSDDLDGEYFGAEGGSTTPDIPLQQDYVQLS